MDSYRNCGFSENIINHPHAFVNVEVLSAFALARHNASRFLASMLQGN